MSEWATDETDPIGELAIRLAAHSHAQEDEHGEWTWRDIAAEAIRAAPTSPAPLQVPAQSGEVRERVAAIIRDYNPKLCGTEWPRNAADAILAFLAPAIDGLEVGWPNPCAMGHCPKDDPHCEGCVNPFIEQCAIAGADALSAAWFPTDYNHREARKAVQAAIRKLALTPEDGR